MTESEVKIGDALPTLRAGPISRSTLALYAGASGDLNPIHIDSDFARMAGVGDVFAHGMLNMAYLGNLLTKWRPQSQLRKYRVRFKNIVQVYDELTCSGAVRAIERDGTGVLATIEIAATNQNGIVALEGE